MSCVPLTKCFCTCFSNCVCCLVRYLLLWSFLVAYCHWLLEAQQNLTHCTDHFSSTLCLQMCDSRWIRISDRSVTGTALTTEAVIEPEHLLTVQWAAGWDERNWFCLLPIFMILFCCWQLRGEFDSGTAVCLLPRVHSPHDVASLLKEFLRDLPQCLLTRDLYQAFVATASKYVDWFWSWIFLLFVLKLFYYNAAFRRWPKLILSSLY